ncbi:MAG TPA: STAS domain-containing protein [Anaerolineae bacterium]|nr:STAS domain-containing protein [Anaerolineae bacterium]
MFAEDKSTVPAESRLSVEITEQKSISTVHFGGTYGTLSVILMKEMIDALVRNNRLKLILQFDHLEALDESAYGYLEKIHEKVALYGGAIVVVCPAEESKKICGKLKERYKFLIFPSFEEARGYFIEREF